MNERKVALIKDGKDIGFIRILSKSDKLIIELNGKRGILPQSLELKESLEFEIKAYVGGQLITEGDVVVSIDESKYYVIYSDVIRILIRRTVISGETKNDTLLISIIDKPDGESFHSDSDLVSIDDEGFTVYLEGESDNKYLTKFSIFSVCGFDILSAKVFKTESKEVSINVKGCELLITVRNNLFSSNTKLNVKAVIDKVKRNKSGYCIGINVNNPLSTQELMIVNRVTSEVKLIKPEVSKVSLFRAWLSKLKIVSKYTHNIRFEIKNEDFYEYGYYDLMIKYQENKVIKIQKLKNKSKIFVALGKGNLIYSSVKGDSALLPYFDDGNSLSILYRPKQRGESRFLAQKEFCARILANALGFLFRGKIWLTWETNSYTAQDNSYCFFKYANQYNKNLYYVIDKDSPDYKNLAGLRNVVDFMSFKHLFLLNMAYGVISSQTREHGYIFRAPRTKLLNELYRKKFIFLQHGVTAFKAMRGGQPALSVKSKQNIDFFVTSNDFESKVVRSILGYPEDKSPQLGFSRFDHLVDKSSKNKTILIMPTWREWLEFEDDFVSTEYFIEYENLINEVCERYQEYEVNFYLHIKLKERIDSFKNVSSKVNLIDCGEQSVADLLMEASILITDYSSVAWDFHYMEKPTLFFHFDINRFPKHNSEFHEPDYLFGPKCMSVNDVVKQISVIEDGVSLNRVSHFPHKSNISHSKKILDLMERT
ncbi:CDP-glycerol glycerophosphotransferase family protein [Enterovibrio makurazakiensis]|uniref:CDP-glycerol glycerophosphotransferase family protein n=1 Tax=Enterovibrio makurazakiensis TaxID=2910232 RepID=UPI003D1E08AE